MKPLVKIEMRSSYKLVIMANVVFMLIIAAIVIGLNFHWSQMLDVADFMLPLAAFGLAFVLIFTIFKTMNKSLFTREGYNTFFFPISKNKLILIKIIPHFIWLAVSVLQVILSLWIASMLVPLTSSGSSITMQTLVFFNNHIVSIGILFATRITTIIAFLLTCFVMLLIVNTGAFRELKLFFAFIFSVLLTALLSLGKELTLLRNFLFTDVLLLESSTHQFYYGSVNLTPQNANFYMIRFLSLNYIICDIISVILMFLLIKYLLKNKIEYEL